MSPAGIGILYWAMTLQKVILKYYYKERKFIIVQKPNKNLFTSLMNLNRLQTIIVVVK